MFQIHWTRRHTTLLIYTCVTILIAVLTLLIIIFPGKVTGFLGGLLSAISPVFIGFATAYLLYPICMFFDRKALKFMDKNKPRPRLHGDRDAIVRVTLASRTTRFEVEVPLVTW